MQLVNIYVKNLLKGLLFFGAIYLFFDSLVYFFDIKLLDVGSAWPLSATTYAHLVDKISGVFILLTAIIALVLSSNLEKYREIVYISAVWTFVLGSVFIFISLSTDYASVFNFIPSLLFWLPFYRQYLFFEGLTLIFYSAVVYLWFRSKT